MRNYFKSYHTLKHSFNNSNIIENNCSQAYQDLFTLSVLDGKTNGRYVEIGAENPVDINNTILLEDFGWEGYSLEISRNWENDWKNIRKNELIIYDATKFDHRSKLKELNWNQIDYLQVDTEPPETTLNVCITFLLMKLKFL